MEWPDLKIELTVFVQNLDPGSLKEVQNATFSLEFDYLMTPPREKRILID